QKINNEYWGWVLAGHLYRTTNSGASWNMIFDGNNFSAGCVSLSNVFFKDTLNGIITRGLRCFSKTTNGGFNWFDVPEFNSISSHIGMANDTIGWLSLATDSVLKTYNFFISYGKQHIPVPSVFEIFPLDTSNVYAGRNQNMMIKTTNGGGPLVGIEQISDIIPAEFSLSQNYPNPFNPQTTVEFSLSKDAYVTLTIYDILGKEVSAALNNEYITSGTYKAVLDFGKINVTSGVYFYKLSITDGSSKTLFTESKKLVYIK
ncbi:MAG: T9SS type A sorting domain-containing protein, partial [Ignavibacteria bacterium]|nr:T9SS type A sorting domain-containing protein [Ignavibacteria bacterium]